MNKKKLLIALVIILGALNVIFITFHFIRPKFHPEHQGQRNRSEMVAKQLHLDESQKVAYFNLVEKHQIKMFALRDRQVEIKRNLFSTIGVVNAAEKRKSQLQKLAKINSDIEQLHLKHFDDLHELCREDQMEYFEKFRVKLKTFFAPPPMPK